MRHDLLGLELEHALALLESEGVVPEITETAAPKRAGDARGVLRVVYAADDGVRLIVARFLDPAEQVRQEG